MEAATSRWNTEGSRERAPSLDVGEPRSRGAPSLRREGEKPRWAGAGAGRWGRERGGARTRREAGPGSGRGRDHSPVRGGADGEGRGQGRQTAMGVAVLKSNPGRSRTLVGGAGEGRSR